MKSAVRRFLTLVATLLLLSALVYALLPGPVEVDLAAVHRGPLRVTVDEDGKTRIRERYLLSAPLCGQMQRIGLRAGDRVEVGQIVAIIEPTDPTLLDDRARAQAEARVKSAEAARRQAAPQLERVRANLELAQADLKRYRRLVGDGGASQQELDAAIQKERAATEEVKAAQFALQVADFELEVARSALLRTRPRSPGEADTSRFEVRSPISGRVLRVLQESAAVVTPGQRLLDLGDPTDLEVEVDLLSSDAVKVRPGAKVSLEQWGGPQPLEGRVRLVEPAGFTKVSALGIEEQRVNVLIDLVGPPEERRALGDAYRVEARITVWEASDVLQVPAGALFRHGEGWAVFRIENGKARLSPLRVGRSNGLETEVLDGLEENCQVVVHPGDKVADGVRVTARRPW
jgi:HlyD family secretion protein